MLPEVRLGVSAIPMQMGMILMLAVAVYVPVTYMAMGVTAQVKMGPSGVALRFCPAVFMMYVRQAWALVGQHEHSEQPCEKPAHHGKPT